MQDRLRTAERQRAVAEATAIEERKRRKLQVGLAASILALTTLGGLSFTYRLQQRQARDATVAKLLGEATTLRNLALAQPDDPARWQTALASVRQAGGAVGNDDPVALRQLETLRDEVQAGAVAAERDRTLLNRLVDIRSAKADDRGGWATDAAYADAFREAGLDLAKLPTIEAGERIKARPSAVALTMTAALDDWSAVRRVYLRNPSGARRLAEAAGQADPDPWRNHLRSALDQTDPAKRRTALQDLVGSAKFDDLGAISLDLLGTGLSQAGDPATAESVLRRAQRLHPVDVWVNYDLAWVLEQLARRGDAIRYYTAARAVRPETAHELAHALEKSGESAEAIAVFQDLARLRPRNGRHLGCLGRALQAAGRSQESAPILDAAESANREEIRLRPDHADAPLHSATP